MVRRNSFRIKEQACSRTSTQLSPALTSQPLPASVKQAERFVMSESAGPCLTTKGERECGKGLEHKALPAPVWLPVSVAYASRESLQQPPACGGRGPVYENTTPDMIPYLHLVSITLIGHYTVPELNHWHFSIGMTFKIKSLIFMFLESKTISASVFFST